MNPLARAILERRAQDTYEIWDAHAHFGGYSRFFIPRREPADMMAVMDRAGVSVAVASSLRALEDDTNAGNADTITVVDRWPDRFRGYAVFNPWSTSIDDLARVAAHPRIVGVKVHPDLHEYPVTGARYAEMWQFVADVGLPVLSHTWHASPYDDPSMLGTVAERHPLVSILLGHSGVSPAGFEQCIELAHNYPRLYLEICGSRYSGAVLARTVAAVGAGRVLFGSDMPFIDLRPSLGRVAFAALTDAERSAVLGGTARRLFSRQEGERK